MARRPNPWWWEAEQGWYVNYLGRRRFLGKHPEGAARPKKSDRTGLWNTPRPIEDAFNDLLAGKQEPEKQKVAETAVDDDSVVAVLDDFIGWCRENREPITANRYGQLCQDFVQASGEDGVKFGSLPALKLTSKHVTAWLNGKTTWGATTKKNAITALQAGFNWAVQNRGLARNPIAGMKKPEAKRRSDVITEVQFEEMLALVGDGPFHDLLVVSHDCGARPFEVKELERRHLQFDKKRAVIPASEAKGRKHTRVIYFPSERSIAVLRRLAEEHPTGPLFRNDRGNAWTGDAVKCRFEDIQTDFGLKEMERQGVELDLSDEAIEAMIAKLSPTKKERLTGRTVPKKDWELWKEARQKLIEAQARKYAKRFNHYAFRRTFITEKIIAGADSHVVAKLSGHQSTAMIDRHYSAVADDHEFMLREAMRQIEPKTDGK